MEINLVEEESHIETIGNHRALKYRVIYNGKNINNVPVFKHWLNLMKTENEYDGTVYYCVNCSLFFYFRDIREKNTFKHNDLCFYYDYAQFCEYCGELYTENSFCCYKKGLQRIKIELYEMISLDCYDYLLYFPLFSLIFYFTRIFFIIFNLRQKKGYDINYKNADYDVLIDNKFIFLIFMITSLCYSLIFLILFTGIYIWHIFFLTYIMKLKAKDKNQNFIRY